MDRKYLRLAKHLEKLVLGYPFSDALIDLLKAAYTPVEAEVLLAIPNDLAPLEGVGESRILARSDLPESVVTETLESLAERNLIFSRKKDGRKVYSLLQVGYGMPQTFFWKGPENEYASKMAKRVIDYFKVPVTRDIYGGRPTKTYRYLPVGISIDIPVQGILPPDRIGRVVESATTIAVAHCPCRVSARVLGRTDCSHSLEVCIKYDEMAEYVIDGKIARKISKDEAFQILGNAEKEGLVHMVDNAGGDIKHTCNCCGHYCWNVGIISRRKVPRDVLMAVHFLRETDRDACIGCGECVDICPVGAVEMDNGVASVDRNWCIGCGVCAGVCPADAIHIHRREDISTGLPERFSDLHQNIRAERFSP